MNLSKQGNENTWYFSPDHGQPCQVIETQKLWGETTCRVWLPGRDSVVRVPASRLASLENSGTGTAEDIAYVASAARVADALTQDVLLAPIESSVIPLPHQIKALSRAIAGDRVRYLLADEVGLGKTIEAGLILRELKLRGLVKRVLVIAPKGLVTQWVAEMRTHFNEDFRLLIPSDFSAYRRIAKEDNIWQSHPQVVCPMDSVKPLESRRGWSAKQVADYNQERFEDLVSAGWDLVIVVNLPPAPPVMLHHIPRFLSRYIHDGKKNKIAFVLVDGLALDQWIVIRKEIAKQRANYRFRENAVFAWIPTITSVSRQTAFAGKPPIYFPNSIHATDKEPALWSQFWVDQGLSQQEVAYAKGLGNGPLDSIEEIVARARTRVVGLVVDKVDKIMHGMELGAAGMHNQVRQWACGPFITQLFDLLLENGSVFTRRRITAISRRQVAADLQREPRWICAENVLASIQTYCCAVRSKNVFQKPSNGRLLACRMTIMLCLPRIAPRLSARPKSLSGMAALLLKNSSSLWFRSKGGTHERLVRTDRLQSTHQARMV
jgi:hypothetical protein